MHQARACVLAAALANFACGSNAPEVPKDLLGSASDCAAPGYPSDGIGTENGDVVKNTCFVGYRAPDRIAPTAAHRETIAFSDYYDPAGTKGVSLLLINTAAIWCGACVAEHGTLPDHENELGPEGLVILSTLFQDAKRDGASLEDVERWIANFHTNFPMVADPGVQLERYASTDSAPLNMLVDPRSMKILRKYVGDQGTVMWPYIESELKARSAAR
ncbi:MAG TPA: hypothetical protein VNG33_11460 [Polyangiaceae bacterium]|nr:hypothetical protein [Polyangiaceae bacterium]